MSNVFMTSDVMTNTVAPEKNIQAWIWSQVFHTTLKCVTELADDLDHSVNQSMATQYQVTLWAWIKVGQRYL